MEIVTTKPFKSSSNISEIVSKFAKVCKLRSIGVFPSESNGPLVEESSDVTKEAQCDVVKVHLQANKPKSGSNVCGDAAIMMLFDIVSALKSAYVKLQKAHIPYDPKMISAADEPVMTELEALFKIKHAYKEKQFGKTKSELI